MKLTLIKPNIGRKESSQYIDEGRMEPLPLGVLAGMTPEDIEVALYDERMESIPYDEPSDIVAINVGKYTARRAYEISAEYRKGSVLLIMGGMHAFLVPLKMTQREYAHIDYRSIHYLVTWNMDHDPFAELDERVPGPEIAIL
jgi:hypothetical protein